MSKTVGVPDAVVDYIRRVGVREHPALARCRLETASDPRRGMQIDPEQGAFMQVLAKAVRARRALEVGVFTGYSSTAVALAMKEIHGAQARLVCCDISEEFVGRARAYWREAAVEDVIEARVGPAKASLDAILADEGEGGFDWMFIDADKTGYDAYYEAGLRLLRSGGLMLIDNMRWSGAVADPADRSADTVALRALAEKTAADERVDMTLATIGDGLSVVVKR